MTPVPSRRPAPTTAPLRRTAATLAAAALALSLAACDAFPGARQDNDEQATPSAAAPTLDPAAIAAAEQVSVDPGWLCRPGEGEDPVPSREGGTMTPRTVSAAGNEVTISGDFALEDGAAYGGFAPEALVLPADPTARGLPADGADVEPGTPDSPVPPMVVRARVEVPAGAEDGNEDATDGGATDEGPARAPSAVTARLTLGTCDDAPLPDGQYLLRLSGGGMEGSGRPAERSGWTASEDVMVDVVEGRLRAVPGAVSSTDGEIPADLSSLACGTELAPVGDGDGLAVRAEDPTTTIPAEIPRDSVGDGARARVTVTSTDHGTRALLAGIVVTDPATGTITAGARNAEAIPLQWLDAEGATTGETAWTTHGACHGALSPGTYRAQAFAATVDAEGATHLVLSEPWDVQVVPGDGAD